MHEESENICSCIKVENLEGFLPQIYDMHREWNLLLVSRLLLHFSGL